MFKVIRDPVWNNIQIDREALGVLDTEPFQRLRYVRQLGHAYLVYPGATHTRFEHALGAYHLARRALDILGGRGELEEVPPEEGPVIRLAALLHDVGHFPFSHALEEAGLASHETLARRRFEHPDLREVLDRAGIDNLSDRLADLIAGSSTSPLSGLISGSLDLDKIEYLTRDARMTGVPYGAVDVDRLLHSLTVVQLPDGTLTVGVREKGTSALESLVFARYQMYRNVYWHHTVRSATSMFKRAVRNAIAEGIVDAEWIAGTTDEVLMERLHNNTDDPLVANLRGRKLHKRVADIPGDALPEGAGEWAAHDPDLNEMVEDRVAAELGLAPGEILIDFPAKAGMLEVELPLLTNRGVVEQIGGAEGASLGIDRVRAELYKSARRLRIFAAHRDSVSGRDLHQLVRLTVGEVRRRIDEDISLLA